ncbi:hypothetical protein [Streptomyces rubellomurinus]|uniref:Uncharacterized protein n=2 Tax=Streptomyces TaxID=1883 RepID=A0A0F2TKR1_STRR3|nr:hypothetical protein [Streptomyces rubellomurinus]KJS56495.1 hypothetical protein VM98_06730 [Streptomyces rubellomurinus subsp. indigoferus]KJS63729.1 hypothetical protein VM95_00145 [Streptomyces rubellomurinus]
MDDYAYMPALTTAAADPSAQSWSIDGWRIERAVIQGTSEYVTMNDPLGPESSDVPMRSGGTPVYLVFGEDDPDEPVAALVHPMDGLPVRTEDWGDGLMTPSGLAVLHAHPGNDHLGPAGEMVRRTWAVLHARAAEGDDWMLENFREQLRRVHIDPTDWPVEPVEGDFTNNWLLIPDEAGTGTVLGILVDPDGSSTTTCLDEDGEPVGTLLTFGL